MHVTKEWVEQIRASGLPWALFYSVRNQTMRDLCKYREPEQVDPSQGPVRLFKEDMLTLKDVWPQDDKNECALVHADSPQIRRSPYNTVFAHYLPVEFSMYTYRVWENGMDRQLFDDALTAMEDIRPLGTHLMLMELNKYGYLKHDIVAAFERETDAILFSAAMANARAAKPKRDW